MNTFQNPFEPEPAACFSSRNYVRAWACHRRGFFSGSQYDLHVPILSRIAGLKTEEAFISELCETPFPHVYQQATLHEARVL